MPDLEDIARTAAATRTEIHAGHASCRPMSENHDAVGMAGELAFGKAVGLMPDFEPRIGGDNGIDFILPLVLTVDVKTFRRPGNLIHEVGKPFADLFVLAGYRDEDGSAELIGWATGSDLRKAPTRDFGHEVISHYIPAKDLRPMSQLLGKMLLTRGKAP